MNHITPINYRIHLEPDLKTFLFSARTDLVLEASAPVDRITLHASELAIKRCDLLAKGNAVPCPFAMDPKKEEMTVSLPEPVKGQLTLRIDYTGEINDRMGGFYRSRYSAGGREKFMALTQFQESDARKAIPCMDHPSQKATFDLEMVIDRDLTAISNCPVEEETFLEDGKKQVRFQQTPRMSTYLLFFGVGEFEFVEDPGHVTVRVAAMPGNAAYAHFGLSFGRKSLTYCEDYYGIAFPLPKVDLIAIADFAFGAMENWGAITFRENLLLHHPGITSKSGEEGICDVIAHEMAHQWFGNLVTPSDWKYLWLNESFATYFGYGVVDHYYPEWEMWDRFLESQTRTAMERDAMHRTVSIEIPGGENVIINSSTAPIIYNKGGSVLRQIKGFIGEENFKEGLRYYLKKHAYGCASSHHLWEALEEVSKKPVTRLMKSWVEQKGFPLVEVKRSENALEFTQKRFTYLPNTFDQTWTIPVSVDLFSPTGEKKTHTFLFEAANTSVPIKNDTVAYKVNPDQTGFFRVKYVSGNDFGALGKMVEDKTVPARDRWGIQNDLYALVKKGEATIEDYLSFLSYYRNEDSYLPLSNIVVNLHHAYLVLKDIGRERVVNFGRSFLEKVLAGIGYEPAPEENATRSLLRDQVLFHAATYGSDEAAAFAMKKLKLMMANEPVHPDIAGSTMLVGAANGDETVLDWFISRFKSSGAEHERMNILKALGCFREKALIEKVRDFILDEVPQRNKYVPIVFMGANLHALEGLWDWFISRQEAFETFHPMLLERVIVGIVPTAGLGREKEVRAFFDNYLNGKEKTADVVQMTLELLEINSRMRNSP